LFVGMIVPGKVMPEIGAGPRSGAHSPVDQAIRSPPGIRKKSVRSSLRAKGSTAANVIADGHHENIDLAAAYPAGHAAGEHADPPMNL